MGCKGSNCRYEPDKFMGLDQGPGCIERECCNECKEDSCENPIKVLSNNVIWNGCRLRYIDARPGDSVQDLLTRLDHQLECMQKQYVELLDAYRELFEKINRENKNE